jgi:GDPmannose 4,6-dehydratase
MKTALITGIYGMVGSHMADFLLEKGYKVYGTSRNINAQAFNIEKCKDRIQVIQADLNDQTSLFKAVEISNPDEIYNFGAVSFAPNSWLTPEYTANVNGVAVLKILEIIKQFNSKIRLYQASTSEIFGNLKNTTANEDTVPYPKSPYGVAKLYAQWIIKNYRESYNVYACNGISFNHESERRGIEFVTRKITKSVAEIALGKKENIELGNLDVSRDWGYAPDFIEAMWLMLQDEYSDDYVIATNKSHTLDYLLQTAFSCVDISDYKKYVKINPKFIRANEIHNLKGDYSKIESKLGWKPKTSFENMIKIMVDNDLKLLQK